LPENGQRHDAYKKFILRTPGFAAGEIFVIFPVLNTPKPIPDFFHPDFGKTEWMEKAMRKIRTALLTGAVIVGIGAVAAALAPSLAHSKATTHELTLLLPDGGTETIAYTGSAVPKVTFHQTATVWPAPFSASWMMPSFVALDPVIAGMERQFDMLANLPLLMPQVPGQPLTAAALGKLPPGTSYSIVSQTAGNGVCTRFTQITKAAGDAKPKIVSQSSGDCETGSHSAGHAGQTAINLRDMPAPAATQSM